mgnify:CR=1 FL=1
MNKLQNYNPYLRSAGYVRESDIAFTFKSIDNVDVTWDLHNEHFIEYYNEVMLYIDNRN